MKFKVAIEKIMLTRLIGYDPFHEIHFQSKITVTDLLAYTDVPELLSFTLEA